MVRTVRNVVLSITVLAVTASPPALYGQQKCEDVTTLTLPATTITSVKLVQSGPFTADPDWLGPIGPVDLPEFCRVLGSIKPTADSEINFELWVPTATWNGKFLQVGNGGFAGVIVYRAMVAALERGYVTASTDDGHKGYSDVNWAVGHPEKIVDFAYRAVHSTAEVSKATIHFFWGREPLFSYFSGCSEGGREALMEAQRFPDDFDGIIVGAPANFWTHQFAGFVWNEQATLNDPESYVPPSKLPAIQGAVLKQCANPEGANDVAFEDPRECRFDPKSLQCTGDDRPDCLTAKQIAAAKKIYAGPSNPRTHEQIYPGYEPGNEAAPENWPAWITGEAPGKSLQTFFGNTFFGGMVFANPKWDFRTFNFDRDLRIADQKLGSALNAINPDLRRFQEHGGKIIQYHGWADSAVAPLASINYYENVVAAHTGKSGHAGHSDSLAVVQSFYRLFMVPAMAHCSGGPGANNFGNQSNVAPPQFDAWHDVTSALDEWVERGVPPDKIIATGYVEDNHATGVAETHLLCPYPEEAKWTGQGSAKDATNFVCAIRAKHSSASRLSPLKTRSTGTDSEKQ